MFVNPNQISDSLEIEPGMIAADFGAGSGFYTLALAQKVGQSGKVYAFDIQPNSLEIIRSKAKVFRLLNIEAIRADLEKHGSTQLKNGLVDLVLISNILFQIQNKKELIEEAKRILKPNGSVAVVEWDKKDGKIGPPVSQRISPEETEKLFKENGFFRRKEFYAGEYHYGLTFGKNA